MLTFDAPRLIIKTLILFLSKILNTFEIIIEDLERSEIQLIIETFWCLTISYMLPISLSDSLTID